MHDYNRNVTIAALVSALLILGASIWTESRKPLFAGGFLIGGLLTLIYGLMRGLTSGVTAVAFFSVAVGLFVVVYLGHQRFFSARAVEARAKAREDDLKTRYARIPVQPPYAPAQQLPRAGSVPVPPGPALPVAATAAGPTARTALPAAAGQYPQQGQYSPSRSQCSSHTHRRRESPGSASGPGRRGTPSAPDTGPAAPFTAGPGGYLLRCVVERLLPLGMLAAGFLPAAGSPPGQIVGRGQLAGALGLGLAAGRVWTGLVTGRVWTDLDTGRAWTGSRG